MRFFTEAEAKLFEAFCQLADASPIVGKGEGIQVHTREGKSGIYRMVKTGGKLTLELDPPA